MKTYQCVCGKTFTDPQKFNGHKQGCKIHITKKYGSLEAYYQIKNRSKQKGNETRKKKTLERKEALRKQWVAEKHICENCGKVMTEKFGSGRFCSRSCANSHKKSESTKQKIKKSLLDYNTANVSKSRNLSNKLQAEYALNPTLCVICGNALPYSQRKRITCSRACYNKLRSNIRLDKIQSQGLSISRINKRYKYGFYRDIPCDSSWELAFLVYVLENYSVSIKRNVDWFSYIYENQEHLYNPDFLVNDTYIEIKNYYTEQVGAKIQYFPDDKQLIVLYKKDIDICIKYCIQKYGKKFWEVLYDKDKPNYLT